MPLFKSGNYALCVRAHAGVPVCLRLRVHACACACMRACVSALFVSVCAESRLVFITSCVHDACMCGLAHPPSFGWSNVSYLAVSGGYSVRKQELTWTCLLTQIIATRRTFSLTPQRQEPEAWRRSVVYDPV
jgi:hypothetical protein